MTKSIQEMISLIDVIPDEPAKEGEFILPELMSIAVAKEVRNDDIVFAGTGLPMVGIMTANLTVAPNALLIYEAGICDGKTIHTPMSVCDQRAANLSSSLGGLVDTFGYYLQRGLVTLGFLGGASIDKYGGVNVTCIGDYFSPKNRFTGSGGNSDIGTLSKRTVFIILQEKRRFLEKNDYTTTPGWWCTDWKDKKWKRKSEVWEGTKFADNGPEAVVTNMGTYRFDDDGIMYLDTTHTGVTVETIKENCGFDINVDKYKGNTKLPTYRELFVLREFVDPELIFLPKKVDYPPEIQKIIDS